MDIRIGSLAVENITDLPAYARIERSGRVCYRSEDRITDDSAVKFVKMIVKNGHYSVLGHSQLVVVVPMEDAVDVDLFCPQHMKHQFTFIPRENDMVIGAGFDSWLQLFESTDIAFASKFAETFPEVFGKFASDEKYPHDVFKVDDSVSMTMEQFQYMMKETYVLTVDRATAMQLRTYRFATHSVESQRYNNYVKKGFTYMVPPEIAGNNEMVEWWKDKKQKEADNYACMIDKGFLLETARIMLGQDICTTMVITASLWEWRHIFHCRLNSHTQSNARQIVQMVKDDLLSKYKNTPVAKWLED